MIGNKARKNIIPNQDSEAFKANIQHRKDEEETQKLLEENAPRKHKAASEQ